MNQVGSAPGDGSDGTDVLGDATVIVAPGAGANINNTVTITKNGTWLFRVWAGFDRGAPAAAVDSNNMQLFIANVSLGRLPTPAVLGRLDYFDFLYNLQPATITLPAALSVRAVGAGTAGVGYLVGLSARRIRGS